MSNISTLKFTVRRQEPTLVPPAESTPHEFKPLSDIDDQESLRHQTPIVQFYASNPSSMNRGRDPASVIKEALAKVLVFYYPFAGRIREGKNRKLVVETTGDGVVFVEADADVGLHEFGDVQPPCPCIEDLLFDVPGSAAVVGGPLLLIQVTRLRCGGVVVGVRMNHAMCDGAGIGQFMVGLGEVARGLEVPSVVPVWKRELLNARDPPRPTWPHLEYEEGTTSLVVDEDEKVERCFFFGEKEMETLRSSLPERLRYCSRYDLLTATLWRARTSALRTPVDEQVKLLCVVNARTRYSPPLPVGFYGNAIGIPAVVSTAGELLRAELGDVVEMVRRATESVTDEYMRSTADAIVARGRPCASTVGTYHVSDLTGHGFGNVDFGWGPPVYAGIARVGTNPGVASFYIAYRTTRGDSGLLVPAVLPAAAMDRFHEELRAATAAGSQVENSGTVSG